MSHKQSLESTIASSSSSTPFELELEHLLNDYLYYDRPKLDLVNFIVGFILALALSLLVLSWYLLTRLLIQQRVTKATDERRLLREKGLCCAV